MKNQIANIEEMIWYSWNSWWGISVKLIVDWNASSTRLFCLFFILTQIFLCGIYKIRLCKTLKNTNGSCTKSIFLWFFFQYRLLFYVFSEYDNIKWEDHFSIIVFFLYDGWLSKKMSLVKTFLLLWTTKHHKETAGKKTTHYTIEVKSIINGINICT